MDLRDISFMGNSLLDCGFALGVILAAFVLTKLCQHVLRRYVRRLAALSKTRLDDMIADRVLPAAVYLVFVGGLWVAYGHLTIPDLLATGIEKGLVAAALVLVFLVLVRLVVGSVDVVAGAYVGRLEARGVEDLEAQRALADRVRKQVREVAAMLLWGLGILTLLSNLGVNLKAIWASLGIGGIALVVAVKDPLTNLVGRIYIYGTGIFDEGHFIVFGAWAGSVIKIGLFRTYLELFSDMTTVSIPNADFVKGVVKTYFGRKKFMYKWDLDVPYDTPPEKIEALVGRLREHVLGKEETNPEMCWIYLERLDRYSKVIRVWFQSGLPSWAESLFYGDQLLQEIQGIFEDQGVAFAFPTQTLHVEGLAALAAAEKAGVSA
jgi:MscS family membrane protein